MKIISKFQDFYDSYQFNYGEDVYYDRNMNLRKLNQINGYDFIEDSPLIRNCTELFKKYLPRDLSSCDYKTKTNSNLITFNIVFIGEQIIPYITLFQDGNFLNIKDSINFYDIDSFESFYNESKIFKGYTIKNVRNHFKQNYIDLYNKIRIITKEPIISFSNYRNEDSNISRYIQMTFGTMLNPSLKELGFSKILDSLFIIQELELFIKKYNNIEKNIEFSNELKINNAGFDKNSFKY